MKIIALRHSYTKLNEEKRIQGRLDIKLSKKGILAVYENIEYISKIDFDLIVSSPLMRALQTSLIIGEKTNYKNPIVLLHEFVERDFGKLAIDRTKAIERIMNKGSVNAKRCLELASGAEHTETELKATKKSEINTECPSLANPNYVPYE